MSKLKRGDKAPDFSLPDQEEKVHTLGDYKGRWLLLYFYPKDNTPGCTKEACEFRDNFSKLSERIEIVGVSADSVKSHKGFAEKHRLPFTLLSDSQRKTIKDYGTDGVILAKRASFLINPKGNIEKIYEKVDPSTHAEEVLKDLKK